ncbi:rod shape-determining protein MreC [Sphingomonas solaris]|uniref:Cell shape-determining protein MreC n=1 Tax=Alterirhizorhabdus solaris TaxID=2529389 RepID=A0A558RCW2_9SPHN|nr:rod shape-determining protein MreC [Sphingomonas solaris]TVV77325.1 rod shape-determining protein MreC [Sphingomonas solaris]
MAPPPNRRPGFSRRAQLGLFTGYVVAVAGLLAGLGLILSARLDPQGFAAIRGVAIDATAPVSAIGRDMVRGVDVVGETITAYLDAAGQNRALRAEMKAARGRLVEARALDFENRRLKRLLHLIEDAPATVAVARIVSSTATSPRRLAILHAGTNDGVAEGQPVRSPEGLVGTVVATGRIAAQVLLLTDSGSAVPVRLARSGVPALAAGKGDGRIELRALVAGATPFRRGDIALSSGTGGVFPPDIPVAVVTAVNGDLATAWPLADPARLDFATVLKVFQPDIPPPPPPPAKK